MLLKHLRKEENKMYDDNNIFAKIIRGEIPCKKIYEDENSVFFNDINPKAKIHVLAVPKEKYISFSDFMKNAPKEEVYEFFSKIHHVVKLLKIDKTGYQIISNDGKDANQEVPHFHVHILGGGRLSNF